MQQRYRIGIRDLKVFVVKFEGEDCRSVELSNRVWMGNVSYDGYKYLGMQELDNILHRRMEIKVTIACLQRLKFLWKSKLNARNLETVINTWNVIIANLFWNRHEQRLTNSIAQTKDHFAQTKYTMSKANVYRLYMQMCHGRRDLFNVQECINSERKTWLVFGKLIAKPAMVK